jgi:hypothetical protein
MASESFSERRNSPKLSAALEPCGRGRLASASVVSLEASMGGSMKMPTSVRHLNASERQIVERVFTADTLPSNWRVVITNGAGADGRPFTIPTSLLTAAAPAAFFALVTKNPILTALAAVGGAMAGTVLSFANLGYLMSVGPDMYGDLTATDRSNQDNDAQATLVHEMTHAWQGKNSKLALSYVWGSVISQCKGAASGATTSAAYNYRIHAPWKDMNPEQQAKLVEDWFWQDRESTTPEAAGGSGRFEYIRDYVRRGIT